MTAVAPTELVNGLSPLSSIAAGVIVGVAGMA